MRIERGMSLVCFVGIHEKMPIMAHRGTCLAHQTRLVGHVTPHIHILTVYEYMEQFKKKNQKSRL